jgi:hypothetical protein
VAEEAVAKSPDVVLGFDAAWGFAPDDQTSPALASQPARHARTQRIPFHARAS